MKIEFVSSTGDVVGTAATGPDGTVVATGEGQKWVSEFPSLPDYTTPAAAWGHRTATRT